MAETWNGVSVKYQLLTIGTRRPGRQLRKGKPEFLVAHDTGNPNSTAQNNVDYYENTHNIQQGIASAHIFVDDKEAIICIPVTEIAYHVLPSTTIDNAWYGVNANDGAAGVEICYFTNKTRSQKSLDNGARVLAYLAEYWGIDYKTAMPGHQDIQNDKSDPGNALQASGYERATANLDNIVAKYYKKDDTPAEQITWNWAGRFTSNTTIKVRRAPGLSGEIVDSESWIYAKQWVDFVSVTKKDGYWWIKFKYPTNIGAGYFYLPVCEITDEKERIKYEKYWGSIEWE